MRKIVILILLLVMLVPAIGQAQSDDWHVALVVNSTEGYFGVLASSVQLAADEAEVELTTVSTIEEAIEAEVDAILLVPYAPEADQTAILAANEAEIPVYLVGGEQLPVEEEAEEVPEIAAVINVSSAELGTFAAESLCEVLPADAAVLEVIDFTDMETAEEQPLSERQTAFQEGLAEACSGVTVSSVDVTGLESDAATEQLVEQLQANTVAAMIGYSDQTALDAANAVLVARARRTQVVGFGLNNEVATAIQNGQITLTIAPDPATLGETAIEYMLAHLEDPDEMASLEVMLTIVDSGVVTATRCRGSSPPCPN